MKKLFMVPLFVLVGCGGGQTTLEVGAHATNLQKALQTPSEFMAAITMFEMLRGADDADPGVIFDAGDDVYSAALVDLTESDQKLYAGDIPERYLGEYTHCRVTVAAAGQVISYADASGVAQEQGYLEAYQAFDNSDGSIARLPSGNIELGDVLLLEGEQFHWFEIDASKTYSHNADRGALTAYQDASPGDAVQTIELNQPITIEAGGAYQLSINFDVTDTFEFTDRDSDAIFEPLSDDHDGTVNGIAFGMVVPGVQVSLVE